MSAAYRRKGKNKPSKGYLRAVARSKALAERLRKDAQKRKARQSASKLANIAQRSDDAVDKSKKPRVIKIEGDEQKAAVAGDTVPIVFCKRDGSVGGVWLQPALSKRCVFSTFSPLISHHLLNS